MKLFSKLSSLLLGGSLLFGPSAVATTIEEHQRLIDSLESVGIEVVLNDVAFCGEEPVDGAYFPINSVLVVCQDYSSSISSKEVEWTPNDLDTLRHETHHVVQDCRKGVLGDRESSLLFDEKGEFNLRHHCIDDKQIENIIESYRERGRWWNNRHGTWGSVVFDLSSLTPLLIWTICVGYNCYSPRKFPTCVRHFQNYDWLSRQMSLWSLWEHQLFRWSR